jgi:long-chain fatty acid transport protein
MMGGTMRKPILWLAIAAFCALPLAAQNTDIESMSGLQFNFANPGARSLGMGGAFLGLADDASAAEANPAGLTILRKPEISVEVRNFLTAQTLPTSGTYLENIETSDFTHYSHRVQVTFGSFVYPLKKNFVIAAYYHEPLSNNGGGAVVPEVNPFTGRVEKEIPFFYFDRDGKKPVTLTDCLALLNKTPSDPGVCFRGDLNPFLTAVSVNQRTWGVSFAGKIGKKLSLGVSGRYQTFKEGAFTFRVDPFGQPVGLAVQATGSIDQANCKVLDTSCLTVKEEKSITWGAGFKFEATDKISFGGSYKKGPQYNAPAFAAADSTGFKLVPNGDTKFHMPDIYGVGISVRPIPVLTVNFDAVHVTYSNLVDDFISGNGDVRSIPHPYNANDVTELHLGAEYFFTYKIPVAIRAGVWRDPNHALTYAGPLTNYQLVGEAILFPGGKDQFHRSIGLGLAWPRFQVDAAYDTAPRYKVGSVSAVMRF